MVRTGHICPLALISFLTIFYDKALGQEVVEFESNFGGPWSDGARTIVRMSDDGFALGGWKARESRPEVTDGWIVRVDSRGRYMWDLPIESEGDNGIRATAPAFDGGLLAVINDGSSSSSQVRLSKVSPSGSVEWSKNYAGLGVDQISVVHSTFDGGVIMAGKTALDASANTSGWIVKLDRTYETQWVRTLRKTQSLRLYLESLIRPEFSILH